MRRRKSEKQKRIERRRYKMIFKYLFPTTLLVILGSHFIQFFKSNNVFGDIINNHKNSNNEININVEEKDNNQEEDVTNVVEISVIDEFPQVNLEEVAEPIDIFELISNFQLSEKSDEELCTSYDRRTIQVVSFYGKHYLFNFTLEATKDGHILKSEPIFYNNIGYNIYMYDDYCGQNLSLGNICVNSCSKDGEIYSEFELDGNVIPIDKNIRCGTLESYGYDVDEKVTIEELIKIQNELNNNDFSYVPKITF